MSAGFTFPWEQAAMRNDDMPDGLCVYEQAAFQAVRWLYRLYREKAIDREAAGKEKRKIKRALDAGVENAKYQDRLAKYRADMFKHVEAANSAYRLSSNHTPEADRLSDTILGMKGAEPMKTENDRFIAWLQNEYMKSGYVEAMDFPEYLWRFSDGMKKKWEAENGG